MSDPAPALPETAADTVAAPLLRLTPADARRVGLRLRRGVRELDAALSVANGPGDWGGQLEWSIDPEPIVLEAEAWDLIESAVHQRARVLNCVLADLYSLQEVLRQRLLPAELVLGDPYFRRPCVGLEPGRASLATVLRFDLMRDAAGKWIFVESFSNTPIGASFAVQNRRFLTQERGDFFAGLPEFRSVTDFPIRLLDHLKRLSPRDTENPNIVLLTAGPGDPAFFEHSFLARKMGLPLAQGADLLVLDDRVFFKTVGGLVPVDVVYRRVNDAHVDPVVFSTDRLSGIPGLVASIRARRVAVANAIGAGVADNRALESYLPRLTRYYLGEKLVLPGVPTYYCGDVDQRAVVHDDTAGELALLPAQPFPADLPSAFPGGPPATRQRALTALSRAPHLYVARRMLEPFAHEASDGRRGAREIRLSCYALCDGRRIEVMPGGLVRLLPTKRPADPPSWQIGETADIVVLTSADGPPVEEPVAPPDRVRPLLLGSRAADNMFWAGRYAERAEGTARIVSLIEDVGLEEISRRERRAWFPVWRGMLDATGHGSVADDNASAWFTAGLAWQMSLDADNSSSVLTSLRAARDNTLLCRDYFSPETWGVLSRLCEHLDHLAERGVKQRSARRDIATSAIHTALDGLAAFFGTVDRTMLHDTGWNFFQAGMYLERAVMTCGGLRHVLVEAEAAARDNRREEADLTALVRMLSSQDAYRRTYQARTEPLFVAELFLLNRHAPKSVYACLLGVKDALEGIAAQTGAPEDEPIEATWAILGRLDELRLDRFFAKRTDSPSFEITVPVESERAASTSAVIAPAVTPATLAEWIQSLLDQLFGLGTVLHDYYFSLQSRLAPTEEQE